MAILNCVEIAWHLLPVVMFYRARLEFQEIDFGEEGGRNLAL